MKNALRRMLIVLMLMLSLCAVFVCAQADIIAQGTLVTDVLDGMSWSLDENGVLTISGRGVMPDFDAPTQVPTNAVPWWELREQITRVVVGNGVRNIGAFAFEGCTALTQVSLPGTVCSLGDFCFTDCFALTAIELPDTISTIGMNAFEHCYGLTAVELPEGLISLGDSAFRSAKNLKEVTLPSQLSSLPYALFSGTAIESVVIPDQVVSIGTACFSYSNIQSVTIPRSVVEIGLEAFASSQLTDVYYAGSSEDAQRIAIASGNDPLRNAVWHYWYGTGTLPEKKSGLLGSSLRWTLDDEGVLTISGRGTMPDYDRNSPAPWYDLKDQIKRVVVEDGVWNIGASAFQDHTMLRSVSLPDSVCVLGNYCFWNCQMLTDIVLPDSVFSIGSGAFNACTALTKLDLPQGLTSLGYLTLGNTLSLKEIVLPPQLAALPSALFNASGIESLVIPDQVTSIGDRCFEYSRIQSVTIPKSVIQIGQGAFDNVMLTDVYYLGTWEEASRIQLGPDNDPLQNAVWHCSDKTGTIPAPRSGLFGSSLRWALDDEGTLTISGQGLMPDYDWSNSTPWQRFSSEISRVVIEDGVKNVGNYMCYNYPALRSVSLADSVCSLGEYCFSECAALAEVDLPASLLMIKHAAFLLQIAYGAGAARHSAFHW